LGKLRRKVAERCLGKCCTIHHRIASTRSSGSIAHTKSTNRQLFTVFNDRNSQTLGACVLQKALDRNVKRDTIIVNRARAAIKSYLPPSSQFCFTNNGFSALYAFGVLCTGIVG
jgi:hypothetical protein